jgi:IS5 family transposase
MTATNRAAYYRLCWAAAELALTCTASRAFKIETLFAP